MKDIIYSFEKLLKMNKKFSPFNPDVLTKVFLFLEMKYNKKLKLVSKQFNSVIESNTFWNLVYKRDIGVRHDNKRKLYNKFQMYEEFIEHKIIDDIIEVYENNKYYDEIALKCYNLELLKFVEKKFINFYKDEDKNPQLITKFYIYVFLSNNDEKILIEAFQFLEKYQTKKVQYHIYAQFHVLHKFCKDMGGVKNFVEENDISKTSLKRIATAYKMGFLCEDKKFYEKFYQLYK